VQIFNKFRAGQRSYLCRAVHGITCLQCFHGIDKPVQIFIEHGFNYNKALGGDTALSRILITGQNSGLDRKVQIRIFQYNKGI